MKKSVLFLLGKWTVGGVERVTVVVANELVRRGWTVTISAFEFINRSLLQGLDSSVLVCEFDKGRLSTANRKVLSRVIQERNVSVIINQWCVPYSTTRFIREAIGGRNVRLIAFNHTQPNMNGRIQNAKNLIVKLFYKFVSSMNARLVYARSDAYVVLSSSFVNVFERFICSKHLGKLHVIPNPLTLRPIEATQKENIIIYVGRLSETDKKVSRVISIWRLLAPKYNDWKLVVVGDGPDRARYENSARGLERIEFVGFVNPESWYARAKLLLLTSDLEGFGLVLVEAMASGCVPVALGSYPAVYDIVKDNCGKVIPTPFNVERFASEVALLMDDERKLSAFAENALRWSRAFSVDSVVDKYEALFEKLLSKKVQSASPTQC